MRRRVLALAGGGAGLSLIALSVACSALLGIEEDRVFVEDSGTPPVNVPDATSSDAGSDAPVVTPTCVGTIPVKIIIDFTGATRGVATPYFFGEYDYLRELNEKGGIAGCPIDIQYADYGYDLVRAEQIYNGWKDQSEWPRVAAVFGFGSGDTAKLGPLAKAAKVPLISASYAGDIATPDAINKPISVPEVGPTFVETSITTTKVSDGYPYNFFAGTDYSTAIRTAVYHASLLGGKRVAFFGCTAAYCQSPLAAGKTYAQRLGMGIGRDLVLELSGDTEAGYLTKIRAYFQAEADHKAATPNYNEVDWVWVANTTNTASWIGKAVAQVNAERAADGGTSGPIKLLVNTWGFDETLYTACGAACVDNVFGMLPFATYGDPAAIEMSKVIALHDKWRTTDQAAGPDAGVDGGILTENGLPVPAASYGNVRYVQGYVSARLFQLAAEAAVAAGQGVNGETVKAGFETLNRVDTGGLTDKLTFKPKDHRPQSTEAIYKINATGKLQRVPPDRTIFLEDEWLGW